MSALVCEPPQQHRCRIEAGTHLHELQIDGRSARLDWPVIDPPGTVRACGECGKTWVAHRPPQQLGYTPDFVDWRPESRLARWWRERRTRRTA